MMAVYKVRWLALLGLLVFSLLSMACVAQEIHRPVLLTESSLRYDLNSALQASGFFTCPAQGGIKEVLNMANERHVPVATTTHPNFKQHPRYCLYLQVKNETSNVDWVLHFSNLFINQISLAVQDGGRVKQFQSDIRKGFKNEKVNVIGRGFSLQLQPQKTYTLAVEMQSNTLVAAPYFGLMSRQYYERWSTKLYHIFYISMGVIIGLVMIALLCSVVLRDITFFWFGISSSLLLIFFVIRSYVGVYLLQGSAEMPNWLWCWASATLVSVFLFAHAFLQVSNTHPRLNSLFHSAIGLSIASLVLSFFMSDYANVLLYAVNGLVMSLVILYAWRMKQSEEQGNYYLLFLCGWLPVLYAFFDKVVLITYTPEPFVSTLSYEILYEPFLQILHMLIHFVALLMRILKLKQQKYQAELRNEAKSRFLASVSHDLRQPLLSMQMLLAHLERHIPSPAGKDVFSKVYGLHAAMSDSFKKLMELSRVEAGAVTVNKEWIDLVLLIEKMRLEFTPFAQNKGLSLRFRCSIKTLYSDPEHVARILRNLISNALKYTDHGGVLIGFRTYETALLIQVWDTGCGIRQDEQQKVFDIYQRSEIVLEKHTGMGIGLAIVKQLVYVLGGALSLKSVVNRGSMFQVSLPLISVGKFDDQIAITNAQASGLRFIQAFSNQELAKQVSAYLQRWGYFDEGKISQDVSQFMPLVVADLELSPDTTAIWAQVRSLQKQYQSDALIVFVDGIEQSVVASLAKQDIHVLPIDYRPAQLRSLLRYIETR